MNKTIVYVLVALGAWWAWQRFSVGAASVVAPDPPMPPADDYVPATLATQTMEGQVSPMVAEGVVPRPATNHTGAGVLNIPKAGQLGPRVSIEDPGLVPVSNPLSSLWGKLVGAMGGTTSITPAGLEPAPPGYKWDHGFGRWQLIPQNAMSLF